MILLSLFLFAAFHGGSLFVCVPPKRLRINSLTHNSWTSLLGWYGGRDLAGGFGVCWVFRHMVCSQKQRSTSATRRMDTVASSLSWWARCPDRRCTSAWQKTKVCPARLPGRSLDEGTRKHETDFSSSGGSDVHSPGEQTQQATKARGRKI